jgi:transposase InsO family protein
VNIHSRARTTPLGRAQLIERVLGGWTVAAAAAAAGVSTRSGYKWLKRYRTEGMAGLQDRSSVPERMPRLTDGDRTNVVLLLRHCRMSSTAISQQLLMPRATVGRVLQRAGLGRLSTPSQASVVRYERAQPGDLLHLDTKKLACIVRVGHRITGDRRGQSRGGGWEFVHVAIDDASRAVYFEVLGDETGATCAAFLRRTVAHFARLGVECRQLLTDNGTGYRSHAFAFECQRLRLGHLRTRPYRPCTNGKAERVIQTMLREWAYARAYRTSADRTRALGAWLNYYNRWRPHGSLGGQPPYSRIPTAVNNVSGTYT